jgi:hypothetical protein
MGCSFGGKMKKGEAGGFALCAALISIFIVSNCVE